MNVDENSRIRRAIEARNLHKGRTGRSTAGDGELIYKRDVSESAMQVRKEVETVECSEPRTT